MKELRINLDEALDWELGDSSLRQALTDETEDRLELGDEEGTISITVEGDEFVCRFTPIEG